MLNGVWGGLGVGVGSLISGVLWRNLGPATTFRLVAVWVFIGFLIFVISDQILKRYRATHPLEVEAGSQDDDGEKDTSLLEAGEGLVELSDEEKKDTLPNEKNSSQFQSLGLFQDDSSSSNDEGEGK